MMTDQHDDPIREPEETLVSADAPEEAWTPPSTLPAPVEQTSRLPIEAFAAVIGVALLCGAGLWLSGQVFYIYIFYNVLVGGAVGWALALAPRKAGFTNMPVLLGAAAVFGAVPYILMRFGFFVQLLPDFQAQGFDPSFLQFLVVFLENDEFFGIEIGLIGNVVILLAEVGITIYYAHAKLADGIASARIASVPHEVISFVVRGLADGWETSRLREELSRRGWRTMADQDRAIGTGFDVIAAMQAREA